ncbi:MAG: LamG-like jellyroll fold domain-containing protein [Burkholderiales bacterium]
MNANAGQVSLAWDAVSGATGYRLYYGTASGSYTSNVDAKTATTYTVANLTDGTRYYFAVRAYNATTTSGYSSEVNKVVGSTAPVANFTATPTTGTAPVTVSFTDTSTGSVTGRSWNFGNGNTSTSTNPSTTYASAGTYTVSLTVTGSGGSNTATKTGYIVVATPNGGSGTGSTSVKAGLVAAYGFEEPSGTQVIDASGYGNQGTISGATRVTTTQFGNVLRFNGSNNWVTVPDKASIDLTTGMTLEAWVYPTTISSWRTVVMKEQTGSASYWLYANNSSNRPANVINVGGSVKQLSAGSQQLPVNTWTHLAATYDGSNQKLYVNGALVGTRAQTGSVALSNGALRIGGNSVWGEYFNGYVDEVRIYNRALTQTEILSDSKLAVVGLVVSTSSNRSNSVPLNGAPLSGNLYVSYKLISPTASSKPAKQVKFWLDDANPNSPTGSPRYTDYNSPFDFAGTNSDGTAKAFSASGLAKGNHTITAQVTLSDGTVLPYIKGTFTVQ